MKRAKKPVAAAKRFRVYQLRNLDYVRGTHDWTYERIAQEVNATPDIVRNILCELFNAHPHLRMDWAVKNDGGNAIKDMYSKMQENMNNG